MERLTEWVGSGKDRFAVARQDRADIGDRDCLNRLGEYEDTGLAPEDIAAGRDTGAVRSLLDALSAGECKGVKGATAYKIQQFAAERGLA